ncbi:hypothetical protein HID58_041537 [Brassica napus]|uniref:BnaCnng42080D protein n=3 Tax=Brassica TaxID=3705 RepID=A0A078JEV3_BRANA|nr:uncharacterized protein BNACNNG42080D [Brassica napus]XP_013695826.1 uncharacterized protein BNACNNG42080D [Brassica napus]XP_013695827.1 uncharacterized protein BNACNNG42080D [Brassica napus]XP_048602242.1 uncharacterized protein BNACNNG42080D [Brassica napus]KAG2248833.1 hypothetical protein Bca52824_088461 [Brassica carinata]KAH0902034.1 hypothetical protein HID58_041537 [Brassica napus]CDY63420.1 BnaCnng42080D [Brassica napus]
MRRFPALINNLKPIFPASGSNGKVVRTIVPKKPGNESNGERETMKKIEESVEPLVAFSRPPPFAPFIGPLVMYSLLQAWSSRDEDG